MFGRAPLTMSLSSERSTGMESSLRIERGEGMPPRPHLRRASADTVAEDTGCDEKQRRVRTQDATRDAMVVDTKLKITFKVISGVQDGPAVAGDQYLGVAILIPRKYSQLFFLSIMADVSDKAILDGLFRLKPVHQNLIFSFSIPGSSL